eukprot:gene14939-biopygen14226
MNLTLHVFWSHRARSLPVCPMLCEGEGGGGRLAGGGSFCPGRRGRTTGNGFCPRTGHHGTRQFHCTSRGTTEYGTGCMGKTFLFPHWGEVIRKKP